MGGYAIISLIAPMNINLHVSFDLLRQANSKIRHLEMLLKQHVVISSRVVVKQIVLSTNIPPAHFETGRNSRQLSVYVRLAKPSIVC